MKPGSQLFQAPQTTGQGGTDRKISVEDAVRIAVLQTVQAGVKEIQDQVETLATSLQDELVKSASDLAIADVPGDNEFLLLVRDMPSFDPGTIHVTVPIYRFIALLGNRFGKKLLARKIRRQFAKSSGPVFSGYFRILKEWSSQVTYRMGRKFETYAERYRAQAVQSPQGQDLTADEVSAIEKDLLLLESSATELIPMAFF